MPNKKITELPSATLPLSGPEEIEIVQGGINKKAQVQDISGTSVTLDTLGINLSRVAVSVVGGTPDTLTLDLNSYQQRKFENTTAISSDFTIVLSNTTNAEEFSLNLSITGAVDITFPSSPDVIMQKSEKDAGRYDDATGILTLTGSTASKFTITFRRFDTIFLADASVLYL